MLFPLIRDEPIIVEVETLEELQEVAALEPDQIILDNFSTNMQENAAAQHITSTLEVSGNLTVENAAQLPQNRDWFLSSWALTKHLEATDLSLHLQD